MNIFIMAFCLPMLIYFLTACATVASIDKYPDGRVTETNIFELGRSEAVTNFSDSSTPGTRTVILGGVTSDVNTKALNEANGAIGTVIGAALKAYTGKP